MDDVHDEEYDSKPAAINMIESSSIKQQDEDDDDWSRQVETDETTPGAAALLLLLNEEDESSFRMASVMEEHGDSGHDDPDGNNNNNSSSNVIPPPPSHPELSLKERLVMRERQRRIETERARLKRQFIALSGNGGGSADDEDYDFFVQEQDRGSEIVSLQNDTLGSATEGTLGEESMRAHPGEESRDQLGFNMERFLRNSEVFNPEPEQMTEDRPTVMERFLSEPVLVQSEPPIEESVPSVLVDDEADGASVSDTGALPDEDQPAIPAESFISFGEGTNVSTNASINVEADDDDIARDPLTSVASMDVQDSVSDDATDEPRVLRLTEADMQEMAAIEEASIGNAPPSDREEEELSEIGELADFGGPSILDPSGNFSQGTPTTAVDSASLLSAGNHSAPHASSTENDKSVDKQNLDEFLGELDVPVTGVVHDHDYSDQPLLIEESVARMPSANSMDEQDRASPPLVNRVLRPGMIPMKPRLVLGDDHVTRAHEPVVVDGFDFDKNAPSSPLPSTHDDSYRDLPLDAWSPVGKMHVSPISFKPSALSSTMEEAPVFPFIASETNQDERGLLDLAPSSKEANEGTPLLGDVPPEVITSPSGFRDSGRSIRNGRRFSIVSIGSIFSDVRSEEEETKEEIQNESEFYLASSMLARAFPERMFALTVTLIFEIPVLLMISGGSDALCQLVGRSRYQLLMGFIPLTSAISGNVGLQASTLTTRAISHTHVTPDNYIPWFLHEIGAACVLGVGMGLLLGGIAFFASGMDFPFGITILFAQFISIVTAGCTGTFAPLLFSFIFRRDSGKWGGPLETAIQDIVGSFAMVIISYHILKLLGPGPIDPSDVCSAAPTDDLA